MLSSEWLVRCIHLARKLTKSRVRRKWMALTHNADTSNDLLTNARTARESIQHMAIIGAVMSHLQITRLQFNLDIPWPPLLVAVMRSVTWPFVSSM